MKGAIVSVNVSGKKGVGKTPVPEVELVSGQGVAGDAHAAPGDRQVSLLAIESIEKQKKKLAETATDGEAPSCSAAGMLAPGAFAENLTTSGLKLTELPLGTRLRVGQDVVLQVSKIGKECPRPCAIYYRLGDCVMPREGIFARVIRGGKTRPGDEVRLDESSDIDRE